ncbi:DUF2306 domain-containing protein [Laceyella sacchari]|jgi:Predicted membrane protein (DUF2306)|uniref:DUF2306 domain-containing protein n=1 Tax=Laceyella sacchari TaxID=37482 RepID=A0ABY5U3N7_LACSH|nr:DUF2306 domain-containing protein [Laceyella sacchari]UWE04251.1 DUF2306 domain-containing protein [Laceyella sacchari]
MKRKLFIAILCFIAVMWVLHTLSKNFMVDPSFHSFLAKKDVALTNQEIWILMIRAHILLALVALIAGPIGLSKRIRVKFAPVHTWSGRIYVLSILLNFFPSIYVSFFASGGMPSTIGFLLLNTLWVVSTVLGYTSIRKKNMVQHTKWIIRSLFLSFANMTIYMIVAVTHHGFKLEYGLAYSIAVWLSWMVNLLIAEWTIRRKLIY